MIGKYCKAGMLRNRLNDLTQIALKWYQGQQQKHKSGYTEDSWVPSPFYWRVKSVENFYLGFRTVYVVFSSVSLKILLSL